MDKDKLYHRRQSPRITASTTDEFSHPPVYIHAFSAFISGYINKKMRYNNYNE